MGSRGERRRGGRPSRLTVAVALELVHQVSRGEPLEEAARQAGLGATTLWRGLAAGRAGDGRFAPLVAALDGARRGSGLAGQLRRHDRDLARLAEFLSRNGAPVSGGGLSRELGQ